MSNPFTIRFDDITLDLGQERRIPDDYAGFNWSQTAILSVDGSLPGYTATSGRNIAFIAEAGGREISGYDDAAAGTPLVFTRDRPFDLLSADLSAAFRSGLQITVTAFADEAGTTRIGSVTLTVDQGAETFTFDPALFSGARRVEINANDGDSGTLDYFGIDNLTVRDSITVISFDDIALGAGQETRIPDDYAGFTWTQTAVYSPDGSLPGYTATSGTNIAFIAEAGGREISGYDDAGAGTPLVFTRAQPFDLLSADLSAAFRSGLQITVTAFADEAGTTRIGSVTLTVDQGAETFTFDPASFSGARRIEINANDGDSGTLDYFGIDNLTVQNSSGAVAPPPPPSPPVEPIPAFDPSDFPSLIAFDVSDDQTTAALIQRYTLEEGGDQLTDLFIQDLVTGDLSLIDFSLAGTAFFDSFIAGGPDLVRVSIDADGSRVAVQGTRPGGDSDIVVLDLDTGSVVQVDTDANGVDLGFAFAPVVSPDGTRVVFGFGTQQSARAIKDLNTGEVTILGLFEAGEVTFAPDGSSVTYPDPFGPGTITLELGAALQAPAAAAVIPTVGLI